MKFFDDILKNPEGKYSRKSATWLVGNVIYIACIVIGLITDRWIPSEILYSVLTLILGIGAMSVFDKKKTHE